MTWHRFEVVKCNSIHPALKPTFRDNFEKSMAPGDPFFFASPSHQHPWCCLCRGFQPPSPYRCWEMIVKHYNDVIIIAMASQITSLMIVYSTTYSGADQRKHQSSASLAFVREIHRWPVNYSHKRPVTRKMFPFDDVIMNKCMFLFPDINSTWPRSKYRLHSTTSSPGEGWVKVTSTTGSVCDDWWGATGS